MDLPVDFKKIQDDFSELMIFNPDILQISLRDNMLRVLIKDDADVENLPATFISDDGYHIGIEYMTPSRLALMDMHREIERKALEEDTDPNKPIRVKVQQYLDRLNKTEKSIWDKLKGIIRK